MTLFTKMNLRIKWVLLLLAVCSADCFGEDIVVSFNGKKANVEQNTKDGINVRVDGANVEVESELSQHEIVVRLKGKSDDGTFLLKSAGKAKVVLDGLSLTSNEGAPLCLKNNNKVDVQVVSGSKNQLVVTACNDTANHKAAVIYAKDKLALYGKGSLDLLASGDGCKGIHGKNDIIISELTLNVKTTGNNLGPDNRGFGPQMGVFGPPEGFGGFEGFGPPEGFGGFGDNPGGFGGFQGAGPPEGEGPEEIEGAGFKQRYISTCKGIKSNGQITINSGNVTVYTSSAGAEGIEGKKGVVINGGTVDVNAVDDAINANGVIAFNGGKTTALSRTNDAVDANPSGGMFPGFFGGPGGGGQKDQESLIQISGGEVYAYSWRGAPEEGFDCDFSPIGINGGTAFSIGAGMGEMPSTPTNATSKQPSVLFLGLNVVKGTEIYLKDKNGKQIFTTKAPFSFNNSSSLFTSPELKVGERYSIECGSYRKDFELAENFTVVR